jgi:ATP-dependent Clp protease adaptor protein ClpS
MRYAVLMAGRQDQTDEAVKERVDTKKQEPTLYKVVLLNDDYTPMDLVVHVLETIFQKSPAEAYRIMMQVHVNGRGIAGVYPWEVAETKADKVVSLASEAGYPLRTTIEEA